MSALEILISDYLSANNHLASDGYHNPDAEKLIEDAKAEHLTLFTAIENYLYGRKEARECEADMRAAIANVNGGAT